jgi:predicted Zn-dependent protease
MTGRTMALAARAPLVVAACIALAGCMSKAERIESGLRKGAQFVAASDWDKASIEARNVLQIDPKNAGAFLIAAQVEDGKDAFRNAFANYSKVVELKPDSIDGRLGLARLYLLAGDPPHAEPLIAGVLATDAGNVRARALDAALHLKRNDKAGALARADDIMKSDQPLAVESGLILGGLYVNAQQVDTSLSVLDKALASHPHDVRLLEMAAEVAQSGQPDAAHLARSAGYYATAAAASPKDDALWRNWATMLIRRKDDQQAEAVLHRAIDADPDNPARTIALLKFTAVFRDPAQAEKGFEAAIDAHPKSDELRFALADFYVSEKRIDDAVHVLQAIADDHANTQAATNAKGQLAALWMEQGKTDQVRTVLADLLKANPRDAAGLVLRSRLEIGGGDYAAAVADLRSAAKDRAGSLEVAELLAKAHHLAGDPQLAREALADAVKFSPGDARAHLMLAADMAQTHETQAASSEVDAAIKADPQNLAARRMKVELALAAGDGPGADDAARDIVAAFPKNPVGHLLRARALALQKKLPAALAEDDAAAALVPADPEPRIAAVTVLVEQRRYADANTRIDAIAAANANSALARELRGELALAMGDLPRAEVSFRQLVALPDAPPTAYKNLAAVRVSRKNLAGAIEVLDAGEKRWPNDVALPAARAEWLGRAGRTDDAIAVYEGILKRVPDSELAANNLAYVLVQTRRGDQPSLDRALQLTHRFATSSQPGYVDTMGLVQYRLGHFAQAADMLARAASLAPNDVTVQLHYGMALVRKGDVQQGSEIVRKALGAKVPLADQDEAQALLARS